MITNAQHFPLRCA